MALDMANSAASSARVRALVSFSLVATVDIPSSSARTSAIHNENFNFRLSGNEHNDLFNFVKHFKAFIKLAEFAKSKGLQKKTLSHNCHIALFHHT